MRSLFVSGKLQNQSHVYHKSVGAGSTLRRLAQGCCAGCRARRAADALHRSQRICSVWTGGIQPQAMPGRDGWLQHRVRLDRASVLPWLVV